LPFTVTDPADDQVPPTILPLNMKVLKRQILVVPAAYVGFTMVEIDGVDGTAYTLIPRSIAEEQEPKAALL
jgi:hypothetical protein